VVYCIIRQSWCGGATVHVIALASRKGGAGKTTLASHLAVQAEAAGDGPVAVMDTDPQGGLAGWWNARAAATPEWIEPANGLSAAIEACRAAGYRALLVDTPPSLSETIADVLALADLILVPVQPSPNDLRAVGGTVELAAASGKPDVSRDAPDSNAVPAALHPQDRRLSANAPNATHPTKVLCLALEGEAPGTSPK
jgi:cellulose biosynthesis protein BcsQ